MDDPYKILGVTRDAGADDIRKAYRKLAKELHPDLRPGDKAAEERFKKVSAAYALLSDAEKRRRFDAGDIDASGQERPSHAYYRAYADSGAGDKYASRESFADFEDLGDVFSDLFGRRGGGGRGFARMRGADVSYTLAVSFIEAARGARKRIAMPGGKTLGVTIPEGTRNGERLRLKGHGMPGAGGGPAGDAYIEVRVEPHPLFEPRGNDIDMTLPVSLAEAVLGTSVTVPTVHGVVVLKVPKGSNTGTTLRLKGKGLKASPSGKRGDQLVTLQVFLPEKPDKELEAFVAEWGRDHAYDARARWKGRV